MIHAAIDIGIGLAVLGVTEALIKPIAKRFAQRKLLRITPQVLRWLDHSLPGMLTATDGPGLEAAVRERFERLSGESWADADLAAFWELFDPRVTADVLAAATAAKHPPAQ